MQLPKKECKHISQILEQSKSALTNKEALKLKDLSNQTIHDACNFQDAGSITIAVLLYALSKIIQRSDFSRMNWNLFLKKFNSTLDLAIKALKQNNQDKYQEYIQQARKVLESQAINIKPYIIEVLKKAAINKGSRIHAHGISLEKTAKLLNTTQWELSEYIGQKMKYEKNNQTINTKTRAQMALEFFK